MGKLKPFLFGAILGAGTAICALQFHIVHSHEGIRVVARTPQPSLGLAYVDIRGWNVEEFADRPELVRALVANGSSDLVASSVTDDVMGAINSDDETLNKLRSFINDSSDSMFGTDGDDSGMLSIPRDGADDGDDKFEDLFSTSFPQDARKSDTVESAAARPEDSSARIARRNDLPSIDEVMSSGPGFDDIKRPDSTDVTRTSATEENAEADTELLESMLFGDNSDVRDDTGKATSNGSAFEDITNTLESRADAALERARRGFREESERAAQDVYNSATRYTRDAVSDAADRSGLGTAMDYLSGSDSTAFGRDDSWRRDSSSGGIPDFDSADTFREDIEEELPAALRAVRDGLDPFID